MIRRLFVFVSMLSSVLFVGILALWILHPWTHFHREVGGGLLVIRLVPGVRGWDAGGAVTIGYPIAYDGEGDEPFPSEHPHIYVGGAGGGHYDMFVMSFSTNDHITTTWITPQRYHVDGMRLRRASFQYSRIAAATAFLPVLGAASLIRRRRANRRATHDGHCPSCGYDLTGNVSGTCPECGGKVG